jgi:hypothetical protein
LVLWLTHDVKYVFDLGMDGSWVNLGLILLCIVCLRLVFLVVQILKINVLGNVFLFLFFELVLLDYLIIVIELFHGFVFVLLHFEMRLSLDLDFIHIVVAITICL